jgi:hypothetical protein
MPDVRLDAGDAAELTELLQFLAEWLARDSGRLGASLEEFVGNPLHLIVRVLAVRAGAHPQGLIVVTRWWLAS